MLQTEWLQAINLFIVVELFIFIFNDHDIKAYLWALRLFYFIIEICFYYNTHNAEEAGCKNL